MTFSSLFTRPANHPKRTIPKQSFCRAPGWNEQASRRVDIAARPASTFCAISFKSPRIRAAPARNFMQEPRKRRRNAGTCITHTMRPRSTTRKVAQLGLGGFLGRQIRTEFLFVHLVATAIRVSCLRLWRWWAVFCGGLSLLVGAAWSEHLGLVFFWFQRIKLNYSACLFCWNLLKIIQEKWNGSFYKICPGKNMFLVIWFWNNVFF